MDCAAQFLPGGQRLTKTDMVLADWGRLKPGSIRETHEHIINVILEVGKIVKLVFYETPTEAFHKKNSSVHQRTK